MKPKTKFQKKAASLLVDPISDVEKEWAEQNCFDNHFVRVRNRNNCLQCGHKWKSDMSLFADKVLEPDCPECGAENMKYVENWNTDHSVYEYYAKIEVVDGFQLVRMFNVEKYMKRKQPVQFIHMEVMRHFVREDGKTDSMQMQCQTMGYTYIDSWLTGSDLEFRTKSHNYFARNRILPYKILPGRSTLAVLRRNGYKGYFKGETPHQFFSAILKHQKAETLLKAGQESLFIKYVGLTSDSHDIITYWDSICICMRNDYIVEDAGDYLDYLEMLDEFGKDLHNPHYVCPDDFHTVHQRYVKKRRAKREAEAEEARRKRISEAEKEYLESKRKYFDIHLTSGELQIRVMKSVKEVIELGDRLHHCLGLSYAKKKSSLILGAYIGESPLEAIEVDLIRMKINQARGLQNKPTQHHEKIVKIVQKNIDAIARRTKIKEVA